MPIYYLTPKLGNIYKRSIFKSRKNIQIDCIEFVKNLILYPVSNQWSQQASQLLQNETIVCPNNQPCYIRDFQSMESFLNWYVSTQNSGAPYKILHFNCSFNSCSVVLYGVFFLNTLVSFSVQVDPGQGTKQKYQGSKNFNFKTKIVLRKRRKVVYIKARVARPRQKTVILSNQSHIPNRKNILLKVKTKNTKYKTKQIFLKISIYVPILFENDNKFASITKLKLVWEINSKTHIENYRKLLRRENVDTDVWNINDLLPTLKWEENK